jgi:hypothetical protein
MTTPLYMTFPESAHSGPTLLLLRVNLVKWSQRTGIAHNFRLDEVRGLIVTLPQEQHYTQFSLQWDLDRFHIHTTRTTDLILRT